MLRIYAIILIAIFGDDPDLIMLIKMLNHKTNKIQANMSC